MTKTRAPQKDPGRTKLGVYDKGQQTRKALIARATALFSQHGFDGTTMEAIAAACAVTRAVPYRYFDSKRDLYLNCLEASFARFAEIPAEAPTASTALAELQRYLGGLITLFADDAMFRKLVLRSIMEDDRSIIDTLILRLFSQPVGELAKRIARVRPACDARTAAYSAISIIVIDLETRKFGSRLKPQPRNPRSTDALLEHVMTLLRHAT